MSIFTELGKTIGGWVKDNVKVRSLDKGELQKLIRNQAERHGQISELYAQFASMTDKVAVQDYQLKVKQYTKLESANIYSMYLKELGTRGATLEQRQFMSSLAKANSEMKRIMTEINKQLDTLIAGDSLNIFNMRISSVAVLGIIRQSEVLVDWTYYFWSQYIKISTNQAEGLPKYRSQFLLKHLRMVATTVSNILDQTGPYSILEDAANLRRKNADLILNFSGPNAGGALNLINPSSYNLGFVDNLFSALSVLNILRHVQEKWDSYQHDKIQQDQVMLDWMTQHVALLRLQQNETSPDDPKYQALVKVIENYDQKITDYAKKIREYEDGE